MHSVGKFERMIMRSEGNLFKNDLDISKAEQRKRLDARRVDPLANWKTSPLDERAKEMESAQCGAGPDVCPDPHRRLDLDRCARRPRNVIRDMLGNCIAVARTGSSRAPTRQLWFATPLHRRSGDLPRETDAPPSTRGGVRAGLAYTRNAQPWPRKD